MYQSGSQARSRSRYRYGARNHTSSCWVRVSQAWAGNQLGAMHIPRVGQEVLISFIGAGNSAPVRAIADGKVVYVNPPTHYSAGATAQNYNAFSEQPAWTDNGMVILEHTTEIGHNGTQAVSLKFYSVCMHLKSLGKVKTKTAQGQVQERDLKEGDTLHRKDVVGEAGQLYGQPRHLHFEICMDEANLTTLLGHAPGDHPAADAQPATDGRSDVVFGSAHVYLPAGTPLSTNTRLKNLLSSDQAPWGRLRSNTGQPCPVNDFHQKFKIFFCCSHQAEEGRMS